MAYKDFDGLSLQGETQDSQLTLQADGQTVDLPDSSFVRDADISRDGMDLVLEGPDGTIVIEGYFAAEPAPDLVAPDGATLTPELVESFAQSPMEYAQNGTLSDVSPVGTVQEVAGEATVTRVDGTVETVTLGTPIFQGDVIETDAEGAVNIVFIDETSFAVSEDARLAIDEYVYDPATESGTTNFSVVKGVFVFTSGLIGRDDPDDVEIDTPSGSIGIRGTIIAGDVNTGEITVVEGAIVLRDFSGNEMTLASQFETAQFGQSGIENKGQLSADEVAGKFESISKVSPDLFSSVNDAAVEQNGQAPQDGEGNAEGENAGDDGANASPPGTNNGLGNNNSGLNQTTQNQQNSNNTQQAGNDTATAGADAEPPPPPPPPPPEPDPPADPETYQGDGDPPPNAEPVHFQSAPDVYFAAAETITWQYHFDKDFYDPDGMDFDMSFELSANTITQLDAWVSLGVLTNYEFHGAPGEHGELELFFDSAFPFADGGMDDLDIEIRAIDEDGAASNFVDYNFTAFNPDFDFSGSHFQDNSGEIMRGSAADDFLFIADTNAVSNNKAFLGLGDDAVVFGNGATATNNVVWLGEGENTASFQDGVGNIAVGGYQSDLFDFNVAQNHAFGMDGDDYFKIDLSNTGLVNDLTTTTGTVMHGGHNNLRAAQVLRDVLGLDVGGGGDGHGDTLEMGGNVGTFDFRGVDDYTNFQSIERIDLDSGSDNANTITLDYESIVKMTSHNHILIINTSASDTVNFDNADGMFDGMTQMADDYAFDDAEQGQTADFKDYDVWTDGNVTLLIQVDGGGYDAGNYTGL